MVPSIRLHVPDDLREAAEIKPTPSQAHYLGTVMRRAIGDAVRLFNGRDGEWRASVTQLRRDRATLVVRDRLRAQADEPDIWLAFALLKRDATDLVVQKATELGVSALRPVLTARTVAARVNLHRLGAIAVEAAEQSERLTVPELAEPVTLAALLAGWPPARPLFAAVERSSAPPPRAPGRPAGLLVGPEGGYAPDELELIRRHPFVILASLGPRVLRAETAAIAGLALLQVPPGGE
jgi:16S rRNA (uracil1498-N3)-methyltransferase